MLPSLRKRVTRALIQDQCREIEAFLSRKRGTSVLTSSLILRRRILELRIRRCPTSTRWGTGANRMRSRQDLRRLGELEWVHLKPLQRCRRSRWRTRLWMGNFFHRILAIKTRNLEWHPELFSKQKHLFSNKRKAKRVNHETRTAFPENQHQTRWKPPPPQSSPPRVRSWRTRARATKDRPNHPFSKELWKTTTLNRVNWFWMILISNQSEDSERVMTTNMIRDKIDLEEEHLRREELRRREVGAAGVMESCRNRCCRTEKLKGVKAHLPTEKQDKKWKVQALNLPEYPPATTQVHTWDQRPKKREQDLTWAEAQTPTPAVYRANFTCHDTSETIWPARTEDMSAA